MTLYDLLRMISFRRRETVEETLRRIEDDERAARERVVDEAKKIRERG